MDTTMIPSMRALLSILNEAATDPAGKARLDCVCALGFDVDEPMFHGTTAGEFAAFRPNYRAREQLGFGIHVTPDREFAAKYAHRLMDTSKSGATLPPESALQPPCGETNP